MFNSFNLTAYAYSVSECMHQYKGHITQPNILLPGFHCNMLIIKYWAKGQVADKGSSHASS